MGQAEQAFLDEANVDSGCVSTCVGQREVCPTNTDTRKKRESEKRGGHVLIIFSVLFFSPQFEFVLSMSDVHRVAFFCFFCTLGVS